MRSWDFNIEMVVQVKIDDYYFISFYLILFSFRGVKIWMKMENVGQNEIPKRSR